MHVNKKGAGSSRTSSCTWQRHPVGNFYTDNNNFKIHSLIYAEMILKILWDLWDACHGIKQKNHLVCI